LQQAKFTELIETLNKIMKISQEDEILILRIYVKRCDARRL